ncbi:LPXTG-motif cell wall anchor domain-containing protein [Streptococcus gallolyticus]|uniref:LPXTG-motif cell wall anchor domain-containing protein n=1 Tax=Streptococcus gallolyticus TaxID=315405 RepID=A0A1I7FTB4_9STRE|nr:MucBP domain-containing protein [Streptococcus gallolyticus]SFU39411.1 LPXTG-motif cell wall anchor domain-containing protein [Streptococcus gallolyticus]
MSEELRKKERQRFTIRKTKAWGACSVLLGLSILFVLSPVSVKADDATNSVLENTTVVEDPNETLSVDTDDSSTTPENNNDDNFSEAQEESSVENDIKSKNLNALSQSALSSNSLSSDANDEVSTVTISYTINYVNSEDNSIVSTKTASVDVESTTDTEVASTTVTEKSEAISGYSIASGTSNIITTTLTEGEENVITFYVIPSESTTKDVTGVETVYSRDTSATTNNDSTVANETGEYWPNTNGEILSEYAKSITTSFATAQVYSDEYSATPTLVNYSDLLLYVNGEQVDVATLISDGSSGNPSSIATNLFGENTYFYVKNAFSIYNQETGQIDVYSMKWTLQSVNYSTDDTTIGFSVYETGSGRVNTFLSLGSGSQVQQRGNYINSHVQFFKVVDSENAGSVSVEEAIAAGYIESSAVKIHLGYADIDADESVEITESIIKNVYVSENIALAYQVTDDGFLAVTRKYNDTSNVSETTEGQAYFLMELDVPADGFDISISTVGTKLDASGNNIVGQGSKVAPSILSTIKYPQKLFINYYELDEYGNKTTIKLQDSVVGNGYSGDLYTDAVDENGDKISLTPPSTITDTEGNVWVLISDRTDGTKNTRFIDGTTESINYYYALLTGDVIVHYVGESGNSISDDILDTENGNNGSSYDTTDNKLTSITSNGKLYHLVGVGVEDSDGALTFTSDGKVITSETSSEEQGYLTSTSTSTTETTSSYDSTTEPSTITVTTENRDETTRELLSITEVTTTITVSAVEGSDENLVTKNVTTTIITIPTVEVTYVYKLVTGDVLVHYVDKNGNTISDDVIDEEAAPVNDEYDTTDHKPSEISYNDHTYRLVPSLTEGNETGTVVEGTTEVTYVYELVTGDVLVHYVDKTGNPISDDVIDEEAAPVNDTYDTTDHKPSEINYDDHIYRLVPSLTEGDETGTIVEGTIEVTYVYELVTGDVLVHYVDKDGNTISADVVDEENAPVNDTYDTTDHKPSEITYGGHTYRLVPTLTEGAETGTVVEGITEVTYVYELVTGDVVVHYVDKTGNTISADVVDEENAPINDEYDTTDHKPSEINYNDHTYRLVPTLTEGAETGTVIEGTTEVTYVYELVTGDVIVHYVDKDGNTISDDVVDEDGAPINDSYDTTDHKPSEITYNGHIYRIDTTATEGNETGKVVEGTTEVTYVYELVTGDVLVHYVDKDGNTISDDVVDEDGAPINDSYDTTDHKPSEITYNGHVYRIDPTATEGNETGTVVEGTTEVTYVYELVTGDVLVHYIDKDGNTISADVVDEEDAPVNDDYDTTDHKPTEISYDGHIYRLVPTLTEGNETGTIVEGTTEVTYVYELVTGDVLVHYVDKAGNSIATDVVDEENAPVNDAYDTTDHKPSEITYGGHTYRLVPSLTEGNETGTIVEGTTEVTYVYELVTGDVIVHYVDKDGNTISADVIDEEAAPVNDEYDTTDHKPTEISYNGHIYRLVPSLTEGAETGIVVEGTTEVTYVYELVTGDVVVHYVDKDGNPIADDVVDEEATPVNDEYDTTDHRPTTITVDGVTYHLVESELPSNEIGKVSEGVTEVTYIYQKEIIEVVTHHIDENGNPVADDERGTTPHKTPEELPEYEFVKTTTDEFGNTTHIYKKVEKPVVRKTVAPPTDNPQKHETNVKTVINPTDNKAQSNDFLPNTGNENSSMTSLAGMLVTFIATLLFRKKRKDN